MHPEFSSSRLHLAALTTNDYAFIYELVNSQEWIKFIGDRNIKTFEDAIAYIQKILANTEIHYWIVRIKGEETPIGIITFIKRDYLEYQDIGFAFLANYTKQGFAFEATTTVLHNILPAYDNKQILATTIPENVTSIRLLERLGFLFEKELSIEGEPLLLYALTVEMPGLSDEIFS